MFNINSKYLWISNNTKRHKQAESSMEQSILLHILHVHIIVSWLFPHVTSRLWTGNI